MGEFSIRELEIVDYIVEAINFEIFSIEQQEIDKGKLDYSLCSDNYEKLEVTKKKVTKFKSKIDKCNPVIAAYLIEFAKPTPSEYDFYDWRDRITKNFITSVYQELIEELATEDIERLDKYTFSSIVESKGHKYKRIKDYIQGVCDLNHYTTYKSFLEIPLDENLDYNQILNKLNNAFFKLEAFMKGTTHNYFHFDFSRTFTELFYHTRKTENFTYDNCKSIGEYWQLTEQISRDYDQSDFENHSAYKNKAFRKDCEIINSINFDRINEFTSFATPDEINYETKKKSIVDLIKPTTKTTEVITIKVADKLTGLTEDVNPYPRIFTNFLAYHKFKNLLDEFGNGSENLANYSFVFHRMKKDNLIYDDYQQTQFVFFLLEFDINISRIKPKSQLGNNDLREGIYNRI